MGWQAGMWLCNVFLQGSCAIQTRLHVHRIELDCGRIHVRLGFASAIAMVAQQKLGQLKLSKSYFRTELHFSGNIQCLLEISRRLIGVA